MAGINSLLSGRVEVIGKNLVDAKLLAAAPHILAQNRFLVDSMLDFVIAEVRPRMPMGPGHFGVHARDSYRKDVSSRGTETTGRLWAAMQAYWREYGTLGRFRKGSRASAGMARAALYAVTIGGGGETARPITHHAAAAARKFIDFYYNGLATWWRV